MKKSSKLMRTCAVLLALTLITSCFVGGTLAKYVSQGIGTDSARVAKWGVKVDVKGDGFKTKYNKDDTSSSVKEATVISLDSDKKVVAPGTKGDFGGITISGTPEVAVKIKTTADVELSGWNIGTNDEFYCPLVFTIGDKTICGLHYSAKDAGGEGSFERAIKKAIEEATTKEYEAGTDLSKIDSNEVAYSWAWPFENNDHGSCDTSSSQESTSYHNQSQTDVLDTLLGDNAADVNATTPTIEITVTTTVTQID